MRTRAVSLLNPFRIKAVASAFSIDPERLPAYSSVFVLRFLSDDQRRILKQLSSADMVRILADLTQGILLAPGPACSGTVELSETAVPEPELRAALNRMITFLYHRRKPVWRWNDRVLDFAAGPFIMGILNVTPDSFSDGGRYFSADAAIERGLKMAEEGARIIDIGGESTRPGADPVSPDEEQRRVVPVVEGVRKHSDVLISVDTYKSGIAEAALSRGADLVNDISGALFDDRMPAVASAYGCPLIVMHIKGTPRDMQRDPHYEDVVEEVYTHCEERLLTLRDAGLQHLAVDPGIGFGKRLQDNLTLMRYLEDFTFLDVPVVTGTSRKSFIGQILDKTADDRLYGTLGSVCSSVWHGADVVRVHDVAAVHDALSVLKAIESGYADGYRNGKVRV